MTIQKPELNTAPIHGPFFISIMVVKGTSFCNARDKSRELRLGLYKFIQIHSSRALFLREMLYIFRNMD